MNWFMKLKLLSCEPCKNGGEDCCSCLVEFAVIVSVLKKIRAHSVSCLCIHTEMNSRTMRQSELFPQNIQLNLIHGFLMIVEDSRLKQILLYWNQ